MALITRYSIEKKINSMAGFSAYENGGKGSGNFGHSGRPGKVGGSGNGQATSSSEIDKKIEEAEQRLYDIQDNIDAEADFGGDTSHLESLEQEAEEELKQLKDQKLGGSGNGKSGGSSKEPVGYGGLTAKGESELRELVDKYADYVTGEEMGYFSTIKPDKEEILEPEGLLSRKSEKQTKKATEIAKSIQKMAKEIVADKSLTKEQKAMLMDACGVVYSQLSSALLSGGKIRADDSFSASGVWSKLDRSDKTKTSYAKKIREMGDSVYEIYSARETTAKRYEHTDK